MVSRPSSKRLRHASAHDVDLCEQVEHGAGWVFNVASAEALHPDPRAPVRQHTAGPRNWAFLVPYCSGLPSQHASTRKHRPHHSNTASPATHTKPFLVWLCRCSVLCSHGAVFEATENTIQTLAACIPCMLIDHLEVDISCLHSLGFCALHFAVPELPASLQLCQLRKEY